MISKWKVVEVWIKAWFFTKTIAFKVPHQNSTEFGCFWSKSFQLFLNGKIYIIFDHINALLSILYLIFWYFYNYFWGFELSLSVFHDFLAQKLSFWWKSLFFVKKPYFSRQKNPLFTKFSKNTKKSVIMVLFHWLIKTWILEQFRC